MKQNSTQWTSQKYNTVSFIHCNKYEVLFHILIFKHRTPWLIVAFSGDINATRCIVCSSSDICKIAIYLPQQY